MRNRAVVSKKAATPASGGATEVSLAAAAGSLAVIDDWDESDRAKVNPIVGQAGVAAGAGAVSATVQRVTHASDDPVTTSVQIMDDWDESDRCKVNLIAGQAAITAGAGNVGTNTPRVTLATDDAAIAALITAIQALGTKLDTANGHLAQIVTNTTP